MSRRSRNRRALTCRRGMCTVIRRPQRRPSSQNTHAPVIGRRAGCRGGRARRESRRCETTHRPIASGKIQRRWRGVSAAGYVYVLIGPRPTAGASTHRPRLSSIWNCGPRPPRYLELLTATCARIWNSAGLGPDARFSFRITTALIGFFRSAYGSPHLVLPMLV